MIRPLTSYHVPVRASAGGPVSDVRPTGGEATPVHSSTEFDLATVLQETAREAASLASKLEPGEFVPGKVLVKFRDGLDAAGMDQLAADYAIAVEHRFRLPEPMARSLGGTLAVLDLQQGLTTPQAMAALSHDPRIAYAESDDVVRSIGLDPKLETGAEHVAGAEGRFPNDLAAQQWNLRNAGDEGGREGADIDAPLAWTLTIGDNSQTGPVVAVLDTGIDYNHYDLRDNMWKNPGEIPGNEVDDDGNELVDDVHGANFVAGTGNPMDDAGTGTHYAGIIAAEGNNGQGVTGVNWQGRLMAVKFLGSGGGGSTSDAIRAVAYASDKGARITSNSWTSKKYNQAMADVLRASPALHVCAAGDDGYDNDQRPVYPASYALDNVISVAATGRDDSLAWFSNRGGASVHLAAPGQDIFSTAPEGSLDARSGTGEAAPHVAGVAALIASRYPEADNRAIKNRILTGVDPLPQYEDRLISGGRLNAYQALEDDQTPPGTPADFVASGAGPNSVTLAWTATGDDGTAGNAFGYDLRYSDRPIAAGVPDVDEIAFDQATPVGLGRPATSGTGESYRLDLPPSGEERTLYFALQVIDNVGNRSSTALTGARVGGNPVAFEDRMDSGESHWTAQGGWARVESEGRGMVWTDSPDGDYGPGRDQSLTSVPIDLKGWSDLKLHFDARVDTEPGYDKLKVEVYGTRWWRTKWRPVVELDGLKDWKNHQVDLSDYEGQDVKLRFRFVSDDSRHRDGVYVDNVVVTGTHVQQESL